MSTKSRLIFASVLVFICLCCSWVDLTFGSFYRDPTPPVTEQYILFSNTQPVTGWIPWTMLVATMILAIGLQYAGLGGAFTTVVISYFLAYYWNTQDYWFLSGISFVIIITVVIPLTSKIFSGIAFGAYKLTKGNEPVYFATLGAGGFLSLFLSQTILVVFKMFEFNLGLEFGLFEQVIAILGAVTFGGFLLNLLP